jgi:hypothetical protein
VSVKGDYGHLVYVDRARNMLRVDRIYRDGTRLFYTETAIPVRLAESPDAAIEKFLHDLGEVIALDSRALRSALFE